MFTDRSLFFDSGFRRVRERDETRKRVGLRGSTAERSGTVREGAEGDAILEAHFRRRVPSESFPLGSVSYSELTMCYFGRQDTNVTQYNLLKFALPFRFLLSLFSSSLLD